MCSVQQQHLWLFEFADVEPTIETGDYKFTITFGRNYPNGSIYQ
jgi:hypothetical protein